jgi:hypothetical protein
MESKALYNAAFFPFSDWNRFFTADIHLFLRKTKKDATATITVAMIMRIA